MPSLKVRSQPGKMLFFCLILAIFPILSIAENDFPNNTENIVLNQFITSKYDRIFTGTIEKPTYEAFKKGFIGFINLKRQGSVDARNIFTLIDFTWSSNHRRLWIVDLQMDSVLQNSLVAHGKNTGEEYANNFSNVPHTNKSSLGLFVTGETYIGKHGLSLRLDGMEKGVNHNARKRAIVMHGADYVNRRFSKSVGRIGRSFGCPAVPMEKHETIINAISDKTCLFIYHPKKPYLNNYVLYNETTAFNYLKNIDFII